MFALNGVAESIGLTILQGYGGDLYNWNPLAPFLYWYAGYIVITLLILILFSMNKLKI